MKVILCSDVASLGRAGDVKDVARGYARNFLLPQSLVVEATPAAEHQWAKGKEKRDRIAQDDRKRAQALAEKLGAVSLSFSRQVSPEGRMFGSIGKADIWKSLKSSGYEVDKEAVLLECSIKNTGDHEVELRLDGDVTAKIKVSVVPRA